MKDRKEELFRYFKEIEQKLEQFDSENTLPKADSSDVKKKDEPPVARVYLKTQKRPKKC